MLYRMLILPFPGS